jgi:ankyrin repeat protein
MIMAKSKALRTAIEKGNLKDLETLVAKGSDPNKPLDDGSLPLILAALKGKGAIVKALLAAGARANLRDDGCRETALHYASTPEVAELLVEAGANVNATDEFGQTPLAGAVSAGHAAVVKLLLAHGANPNKRPSRDEDPLLHLPCLEGKTNVVQALLEGGADPDAKSADGVTPLLSVGISGEKNSAEIVSLLLKAGANPNAKMSDGRFPLYAAAVYGTPKLVLALLQGGAKIDLDNGSGETALAAAVYRNRIDTAAVLLKAGASPEARISPKHNDPNRRGKIVRELAAASRSPKIRTLFKGR